MSRLTSWFRGSTASKSAAPSVKSTQTPAEVLSKQIADIEDAMAGVSFIMNDNIEAAEEHLKQGDSAFHEMGMGVAVFMRSVLGFEKSVMAEASARLAQAEKRAWDDMKEAQKKAAGAGPGGKDGRFYPPGTEYALVYAQAQLLSAVVSVLHESLTEGLKGFYKLRKAFMTLNGIMDTERRLLQEHGLEKSSSLKLTPSRASTSHEPMPGSFDDQEFADIDAEENGQASTAPVGNKEKASDSSDESDFVDAREVLSGTQTPLDPAATAGKPETVAPSNPLERAVSAASTAVALLSAHPADAFVHSGSGMATGLLLLLLSLVPPAFSRLLYIIGFAGDRTRGLSLLWRSTRFPNVHGAVAGLTLLAYYNSLLAFADILPSRGNEVAGREGDETGEADADEEDANAAIGYPRRRVAALLADMTQRYPDSRLWKLEEARVLANEKRLPEAIAAMRDNKDSRMKQVTALNNFELGMASLAAQEWQTMRDAFLRAIELNAWSPALYYYMAGCAELESYRDALDELARELEGEGIGSRDDTRWCDLVDELEEFDRLRKHGHEKSNEGATATPGTAAEGSVDDDGQRADPLIPDANKGDKDDVNLSPLLRAALTTTERRSALRRAQRARATAQHYFRRAPALAGKKKMLGRTVPFEQFALRKVAKWEARMADLGVSSLPDAVGPSPALEMAYLWNAMKRMDARSIAVAEKNNAWERCSIGSEGRRKLMEVKDDMGVWAMVQANVHRARGELAAAREVLEEHVLSVDKSHFKGNNRDDYVSPSAHYEVAVVAWIESLRPPPSQPSSDGTTAIDHRAYRKERLDECQARLEKVYKWESFVLDARLGIRVQTGLETLKWVREKEGLF